jgi:hypothetical protein
MFQDTSSTTPPPPQIWLAIFKATNDAAKMTVIAQDLLLWIWPEKKAEDIIEQIGNPARKLFDVDDVELRLKLRELLCPAYDALTTMNHY